MAVLAESALTQGRNQLGEVREAPNYFSISETQDSPQFLAVLSQK